MLAGVGRSVRRFIEPEGQDLSLSDAAIPALKVVRTADNEYRVGGFVFLTEAQAVDFAQRRQKRLPARTEVASDNRAGTTAPMTAASSTTPQSAPPSSKAEQELMAAHGIQRSAAGFRAAGYIFNTLDQAVFFSTRRHGEIAPGPRLHSHQTVARQAALDALPQPAVIKSLLQSLSSPRPAPGKVRWLAGPERVSVCGVEVTLEMVHIGKAGAYDYQASHGLIDPSLKVAATGDPSGATLGYWPDYRRIDPCARRSYLEWLQGGRSDPSIPIGYVFLFFYGLEYRLLKDAAHEEAAAILAEVRRLHAIYGDNHSFSRYAKALIDVAGLLAGEEIPDPELSTEPRAQWELPLELRVALGRKVKDGVPLNAADSLAWVLASPGTYLRTPAQRCARELKALWCRRFEAKWPDGFKVTPPKATISHQYRAAAGNFSAQVAVGLPDLATISGPVNRFRQLLDAIVEDLDSYSRYLGRNPDKKETIGAAVLLPAELHDGEAGRALQSCREQLDAIVRAGEPVIAAALLPLLGVEAPAAGAKIPAATVKPLAAMLDLLDIGFEPDRRYGPAAALCGTTRLMLFNALGGGKVDPDTGAYGTARVMIEVATLAATADGEVVAAELQSISDDIATIGGLGSLERERLLALAKALLHDPPKRKETMARLASLPQAARQQVIRAAAAAVLADGRILPAEVRFLEGLHSVLGLPQQDVYSLLHRGGGADPGPVTVLAERRSAGTPLSRGEAEICLPIDVARLNRIRDETRQVSQLLADIFIDEGETSLAAAQPPQDVSRFGRLDPVHAELLWRVLSKPLATDEFESAARALKLLPDGAIETINEWGFEMFDEAVMEIEDVAFVHEHLVDRLRTMGEMA